MSHKQRRRCDKAMSKNAKKDDDRPDTEGSPGPKFPSSSSNSPGSCGDSPADCFGIQQPQGFSQNPRTKKCLKCNKTFSSAQARDEHIKESYRHSGCMYCDPTMDFGKRSALRLHYQLVHATRFCHF